MRFRCKVTEVNCATAISTFLIACSIFNSALAETTSVDVIHSNSYIGAFVGVGRTDNQLTDVEGFANRGRPGWTVSFDDSSTVGGFLWGKRFETNEIPYRVEVDAMFGNMFALSNQLDPAGLDETVRSRFRWTASVRAGFEYPVGNSVLFSSIGVAVARIEKSVTDMDYHWIGTEPNRRLVVLPDLDDSFRDASIKTGWVVGLGVETPVSENLTLRLEGSYMNFGSSSHNVNHSQNNTCGLEKPRGLCPYLINEKVAVARIAVIYRF